jgi:hypothetical protein
MRRVPTPLLRAPAAAVTVTVPARVRRNLCHTAPSLNVEVERCSTKGVGPLGVDAPNG